MKIELLLSFGLGLYVMRLISVFIKKDKWKDCEIISGYWTYYERRIMVIHTIQRNQKGEYRMKSEGNDYKDHSSYVSAKIRLAEISSTDQYKHLFKEV